MRNAKRSEPAIKMAATRREAISAACKAVWLTSSVVAVRNFLRLLNRRYLPKRKYRKRGVATFLDDPAQYAYIKNLWGTGRVIAIRGDLTLRDTQRPVEMCSAGEGSCLSRSDSARERFVLEVGCDLGRSASRILGSRTVGCFRE